MSSRTRPSSRRQRRDEAAVEAQNRSALREQQRAGRREELLDAAVEAVRTHGRNVSMEDLAAAAGVTKPILYRHFGDRNGLVLAMAERFANELMAQLQEVFARPVEEPREILVGAIDAFLGFLERDPEVYRFLVQKAMGGETQAVTVLDGFLRRIGQQVAVVVGDLLAAEGRDAGGAEPIAHGLVGFVYGAGDWWVERPTMSRARLVDYLATTLWSGLDATGIRAGAPRPDREGNNE